jgi:hypothetical protein
MLLVSGGGTEGIFLGTIASTAITNGVTVSYYVIAIDSSGFEGTSDHRTFTVQPDRTPPVFGEEYPARGFQNTPIVNYTKVVVSFNVTDAGTGVKWVSVVYSNSTDSHHQLTMPPVNLTLAEGDRFDGYWNGTIEPMHNGTVFYYAVACDYAGNRAPSDTRTYDIAPLSAFPTYVSIDFIVYNLNLTSREMTEYIGISLSYMSPYEVDNIFGQVSITGSSYNVTSLVLPRQNGFDYQESYFQNIPIFDVNLWPFDSYRLNITFSLYDTPQFTSNNTSIGFYVEGLAALEFDYSNFTHWSVGKSYWNSVQLVINFTRKPLLNPIMQVIYAVFFVLGSVALIRPTHAARRLELFLGLFTFIVVLFFTITPILQAEGISNIIGPVLPQALLIGLTWSAVALLVASLVVVYLRDEGCFRRLSVTYRLALRHVFNFSLATTALFLTLYFGTVFVGFQSQVHFVLTVQQVRVAVFEGLYLPPIISLAVDFFKPY